MSAVFMCATKQAYTFTRAKAVARHRRRTDDLRIRPYRCPYCRKWHIGRTSEDW